jgi:hypothetical protein
VATSPSSKGGEQELASTHQQSPLFTRRGYLAQLQGRRGFENFTMMENDGGGLQGKLNQDSVSYQIRLEKGQETRLTSWKARVRELKRQCSELQKKTGFSGEQEIHGMVGDAWDEYTTFTRI